MAICEHQMFTQIVQPTESEPTGGSAGDTERELGGKMSPGTYAGFQKGGFICSSNVYACAEHH